MVVRIFFFVALITFFECCLYLKLEKNVLLIASGVVTIIVVIIKLIFLIIRVIADAAIDLSESESSHDDTRPGDIPLEVWEARDLIINPSPSLEAVVSDLIASGLDQEGVMRLVEHVNGNSLARLSSARETHGSDVHVLWMCGRVFFVPFGKGDINSVFPTNHSIWFILMAAIFCFSTCYLPLSLRDEFLAREKWWIAFVTATCVYSILEPPLKDPYELSFPDAWTGLARPVSLSLIATLWICVLKMSGKITELPVFGWNLHWDVVNPYIIDLCWAGVILFPFWVVAGIFGHPVSQIMTILEAFNRYVFGQCGVTSGWHWLRQFLRGSASVAIAWAILSFSDKGVYFGLAIALVTLVNLMPLAFNKQMLSLWPITIVMPFACAVIAFIVGFCVVSMLPDSVDIITYFCLSWLLLFDIVCPYVLSCHLYFLVHLWVFGPSRFVSIFRTISSCIVAPLAISAVLFRCDVGPIYAAFIMTHAVHKAHTEIHWFTWAFLVTVITLPFEFGQENLARNFMFSLLLIAKAEVVLPILRLAFRSRFMFELDASFPDEPLTNLALSLVASLVMITPLPDLAQKGATILWSCITGAPMTPVAGMGFLLEFGPPKPFYFFDWPLNQSMDSQAKDLRRGIAERPLEIPPYQSLTRTLRKQFGSLVKSSRIGYVSAGDMFFVHGSTLNAMIHVISIEPNDYKIQLRGLEYISTTLCHTGEIDTIDRIDREHSSFPNMEAVLSTITSVYTLRGISIPLELYSFTKYDIVQTFVGSTAETILTWFFIAFCRCVAKSNIRACYTQRIPPDADVQVDRFMDQRPLFLAILDHFGNDIPENVVDDLIVIWAVLANMLLNRYQSLSVQNIAAGYHGELSFPDEFSWLASDHLLMDVMVQAVRIGSVYAFYSSAMLTPSFDDGTEAILEFIDTFDESTVVTTVNSDAFVNSFMERKGSIIVMYKIDGMNDSFIVFQLKSEVWSFFQLRHEWVRGFWNSQVKEVMFYDNHWSERLAIQQNPQFLNNLINQLCDSPVGYPAYVSPIVDSYAVPMTTNAF